MPSTTHLSAQSSETTLAATPHARRAGLKYIAVRRQRGWAVGGWLMMNQNWMHLSSFENAADAVLARNYLDASGIPAITEGEEIGTTLRHLSQATGGVRLLVRASDFHTARQLLQGANRHLSTGVFTAKRLTPTWKCLHCGKLIDANFEVCWNCGTGRDGSRDPDFESAKRREADGTVDDSDDSDDDEDPYAPAPPAVEEDGPPEEILVQTAEPAADAAVWICRQCGRRVAQERTNCWSCGASRGGEVNPFHSPATTNFAAPHFALAPDKLLAEELTDKARRACVAALLGVIVLPPLPALYSFWLLLELKFSGQPLPRDARMLYFAAWVINGLVVAEIALIVYSLG